MIILILVPIIIIIIIGMIIMIILILVPIIIIIIITLTLVSLTTFYLKVILNGDRSQSNHASGGRYSTRLVCAFPNIHDFDSHFTPYYALVSSTHELLQA